MIPNKSKIYTEGSLGGEIVNMDFDKNSLSNIMSLLTDMYSDKIMACIREYSTNALDSNIAAGNKDPVNITTPTALHPYLTIKDQGLGLSSEDIREIYSKYGASTKRESNDFNGTLGIGCKAALTYADQFTLTGIKDGVQTLVAISRSADGAGVMEIVSVSPSDEPNGVTIQIPVTDRWDRDKFLDKARDFAKYTQGRVLVNGRCVELDGHFIHDKFWARDSINHWSYREPVIVMGGVAYPVEGDFLNVVSGRGNLVYFADMGEVDFPPSREKLMYTTTTLQTLERIEKEYWHHLKESFQKEINACPDIHEALQKARKIRSQHSASLEFTYNGIDIPNSVYLCIGGWSIHDDYSASSDSHDRARIVPKIIINGWTNKNFTKIQAKKIAKYLEDNYSDLKSESSVILLEEIPDDPFTKEVLSGLTVIPWDDIKAVKMPKPAKTVKPEREWICTNEYSKVPDSSKEIFYGQRSDWSSRMSPLFNSDKIESYYVQSSQEPSFLRKYPNAKPLSNLGKRLVLEWVRGLTPTDMKAFQLHTYFGESWTLKLDEVLDPDLKLLASSSENYHSEKKESLFETRQHMQRLAWHIPDAVLQAEGLTFPELGSGGDEVLDKYPLLKHTTLRHYEFDTPEKEARIKKQMTDYVNHIWKESTANGTV